MISKNIVVEQEIINRVAQSELVTIDLERLLIPGDRIVYDIKDNLFEEIILKEKDFRAFIKSNDWSVYKDKHVAITCSVEAIIPRWAFMLLSISIEPYAQTLVFGDLEDLERELFYKAIRSLNLDDYKDKKIVVKGCGDTAIPTTAYVELTRMLRPHVASIMYGEPCSTVPIYKVPKNKS